MQVTQEEIAELEPWNGNVFVEVQSPRLAYNVETISSSYEFTYLKTEEESLGRPEALKRLTSKINSFISRFKSKFLNATDTSSAYEVLTVTLINKVNLKLKKIKKIYPRYKFVGGVRYEFSVVEAVYSEQILSNFQEYSELLKELSKTNYMFFLENVIRYTTPLFEQNPEIDFISYCGGWIYFGKTVQELEAEQLTVFWTDKFSVPFMVFIDTFTVNRKGLFSSKITRLDEEYKKSDFVSMKTLTNIKLAAIKITQKGKL